MPPIPRSETGRGKKLPETREVSNITSQRLSDFRKLAEIPMPEPGKRTDMQLVQNPDKLEIPEQRLSDFRKLASVI